MKVSVITNLFLVINNPTLEIFITKRLEQYQKFWIDYSAVSLGFQNISIKKFLIKILKNGLVLP
jgi:hypothetical protein